MRKSRTVMFGLDLPEDSASSVVVMGDAIG
jgi:hypothetical protein